MTDSLVERLALALCEYENRHAAEEFPDCNAVGPDGWSVLMGERGKEAYRAKARFMIAAMREPTEAMVRAGESVKAYDGIEEMESYGHPKEVWRVMNDEALK